MTETGDLLALMSLDRALTPAERRRLEARSSGGRAKVVARGYAGSPGKGPADETCGSCKFLVGNQRSKTYYKCGLTKWTFGGATDVRVRSPACEHWVAPSPPEPAA